MTKYKYTTLTDIHCVDDYSDYFEPSYCGEYVIGHADNYLSEEQARHIEENIDTTDEYFRALGEYYKNISYDIVSNYDQVLNEILDDCLLISKSDEPEHDSIDFSYDDKTVTKIKEFIRDHEEQWAEYLKKRYTDRDGFWSFYDNVPDSGDWSDIAEALLDSHKAGSILNFIASTVYPDIDYILTDNTVSVFHIDFEKAIKELQDRPDYPELTAEDIRIRDNRHFYKQLADNNLRLFEEN